MLLWAGLRIHVAVVHIICKFLWTVLVFLCNVGTETLKITCTVLVCILAVIAICNPLWIVLDLVQFYARTENHIKPSDCWYM